MNIFANLIIWFQKKIIKSYEILMRYKATDDIFSVDLVLTNPLIFSFDPLTM